MKRNEKNRRIIDKQIPIEKKSSHFKIFRLDILLFHHSKLQKVVIIWWNRIIIMKNRNSVQCDESCTATTLSSDELSKLSNSSTKAQWRK